MLHSLVPRHGGVARSGTVRAMPSCPNGERCFYISYAHGSDTNAGTRKARPWKDAPGMRGFTGRYSPRTGDQFIFEGGDTWPNAEFPMVATGSGRPGHRDTYGVDRSWHTGSSWTPPTFSAGGANITGVDPNGAGGPQDIFIDLRGHDYITVDDLDLTGFTASELTGSDGTCAAIEIVGDQNITINRVSIPNMAVDSTSFRGPNCFGVQAATYSPYSGNSTVKNSTMSGATNSYATGILCVTNVESNSIQHMIGEVYPCGHGIITGNNLGNCGNPFPAGSSGLHADALQVDNANGTYYIYNNVIHDTGADQSAPNECESLVIGNAGETDYVWNNVLYNIRGNAMSLTQDALPGIGAYIWNNSIEGGFQGITYCVRSGHPSVWTTIVIENNFCSSSASHLADPVISANSKTVDHDVTLTPAQTISRGYGARTSPFPYARRPSKSRRAAPRRGINLRAICTHALRNLCTTTSFAGRLATTSRPSSGAWTIGAY